MERRFAPAFRALGVCEHLCPFSLQDILATLLSPKWDEVFVVTWLNAIWLRVIWLNTIGHLA